MKGNTKNRRNILGAAVLFLMLSSIATVYATTVSDTLIDTEGNLSVGTILEGIWQGTPISDDYVEDNITAKTSKLTQDGAATGQVPKWNGTKWAPANDNYEPDTNANTICAGTQTYLDGEGNCDCLDGGRT